MSVCVPTGVCEALNVTVTPAPVVMVTEGANLTLSCLVSQRKRVNSLLVLRWLYSPPPPLPPPSPPLPPPPSSPPLQPPEVLIVKVTMKRTKLYGNFTRRFPQRKFHLYEEVEGEVYRLSVLNVTGTDGGCYTCRVQEIRKHRNIWRASSNGTAATHLTGKYLKAHMNTHTNTNTHVYTHLNIHFHTLTYMC